MVLRLADFFMRLEARLSYALIGLVQATGYAGGLDSGGRYSEGGASVRSCAADDGGYVPIREEHQNVKCVNGEFWLTAFAAERVPRWQLLAYLDNPCKEKPTPRP